MSILSKLLSSADDAIYSGLGKTISPEVLRQRALQSMNNIDQAFVTQDLGKLINNNNIKIRNAGGGGTPYLQNLYSILTNKK
jgi:hypothetical protein